MDVHAYKHDGYYEIFMLKKNSIVLSRYVIKVDYKKHLITLQLKKKTITKHLFIFLYAFNGQNASEQFKSQDKR